MSEKEIGILFLQSDMREVVAFRLQPPMLHYMVSAKPQHLGHDALREYASDESGLLAVLGKIGYVEREMTTEVMCRILWAYMTTERRFG